MRISTRNDPKPSLSLVPDTSRSDSGLIVATFGAYIKSLNQNPTGDGILSLGIPFEQVPNAHPVMKFVGGTVFEVSVKRVAFDELPAAGTWR